MTTCHMNDCRSFGVIFWNFVAVSDYCGRLLLTLEIGLLALGCVTCEVILEKVLIVICSTNELMTIFMQLLHWPFISFICTQIHHHFVTRMVWQLPLKCQISLKSVPSNKSFQISHPPLSEELNAIGSAGHLQMLHTQSLNMWFYSETLDWFLTCSPKFLWNFCSHFPIWQ